MRRVLQTVQAVRLLELARPFDLNWTPAEQRLVHRLLREKVPKRRQIVKILKISSARFGQLSREIITRLTLLAKAVQSGEFDDKSVRTWAIMLLRLDRRLEKKLLERHITMVVQLLGQESPLAKRESCKSAFEKPSS